MNYFAVPFVSFCGAEAVPCVDVAESYVYSEGKKTSQRAGTAYDILLISKNCERLRVKVPQDTPVFAKADIDMANRSMNFFLVTFKNFQICLYTDRTGKQAISAKADEVVVVGAKSPK